MDGVVEARSSVQTEKGQRDRQEEGRTSGDDEVDVEQEDGHHADHVLRFDHEDGTPKEDESGTSKKADEEDQLGRKLGGETDVHSSL